MKMWTRKWIYEAKNEEEKFVFIHIPKTAGTTFRTVLNNHFSTKDSYPSKKDLKENGGKYISQQDLVSNPKILDKTLITGHLDINLLNHLSPNIKTLVFFRNPIERVFSIIKHIKKHDQHLKNMDPNEIVSRRLDQIVNAQCGAMGFIPKERNFNVVRQNIIDLNFIGISEFFDESLKLCNATFNWELENIEPRNINDEDIYSQLTSKTMARISWALTNEINTYHIAMNQFRLRCEKLDIKLSH